MKKREINTTVVAVAIVVIVAVAGLGFYFVMIKPGVEEGLQIAFKDYGIPEVKLLQPTIKEIQLQHENGEWITLWSDPGGITLTLTADGAEVVLATVSLEAGTYVGTRLLVTTIGVEVDVNRDGDTLDKNVEVIVPEGTLPPPEGGMEELEQINALTVEIEALVDQIETLEAQLKAMGVPPPGEEGPPPEGEGPPPEGEEPPSEGEGPPPEEAQALIDQINEIRTQIDELIAQIEELIGGPGAPRIEGGLVYTGCYLDEKFTDTFNKYIFPVWEANFVYDGISGKILYDLTLHPLKPRGQNISIKVFTTT